MKVRFQLRSLIYMGKINRDRFFLKQIYWNKNESMKCQISKVDFWTLELWGEPGNSWRPKILCILTPTNSIFKFYYRLFSIFDIINEQGPCVQYISYVKVFIQSHVSLGPLWNISIVLFNYLYIKYILVRLYAICMH